MTCWTSVKYQANITNFLTIWPKIVGKRLGLMTFWRRLRPPKWFSREILNALWNWQKRLMMLQIKLWRNLPPKYAQIASFSSNISVCTKCLKCWSKIELPKKTLKWSKRFYSRSNACILPTKLSFSLENLFKTWWLPKKTKFLWNWLIKFFLRWSTNRVESLMLSRNF